MSHAHVPRLDASPTWRRRSLLRGTALAMHVVSLVCVPASTSEERVQGERGVKHMPVAPQFEHKGGDGSGGGGGCCCDGGEALVVVVVVFASLQNRVEAR